MKNIGTARKLKSKWQMKKKKICYWLLTINYFAPEREETSWGWAVPSSGSSWIDCWANIYVVFHAVFHLFKIVSDATRVDLQMFCWFQANKLIFHWGSFPLRLSSTEVVFQLGCLPMRSPSTEISSTEVVFHWGSLPLRLSSMEVVFHWGYFPLMSFSIEVVFQRGCLP